MSKSYDDPDLRPLRWASPAAYPLVLFVLPAINLLFGRSQPKSI